MKVASVVIERAVEALDKPFTYMIPDTPEFDRLEPGYRVSVPLGRGRATGIVVAVDDESPLNGLLKPIDGLLDEYPVLSPTLIELADWMASRYLCYWSQALKAMIPSAVRRGVRARPDEVFYQVRGSRTGRASKRQEMFEYLSRRGVVARSELSRAFPGALATLRALVQEGTVQSVEPVDFQGTAPVVVLTEEQQSALADISNGNFPVWLLEGVTGSGKTEVYLTLIQSAVAGGGQALVLVPEISLTPQTLERFQVRFGRAVKVWHSQLSDGERVDTWHGVRTGTVQIVVGARSAVFLPFQNLQVLILDEEHESTYKQEDHPRYHTRDVAEWRARREGAVLLLGSATPSLETAHRARNGQIGWVQLTKRVLGRALPSIEVVDMRDELHQGNREMFSRALRVKMDRALNDGQQVILFLNRRGYANFILCRDCGQAVACSSCAVTMTYHQQENRLECHYCFTTRDVPTVCPTCASRKIRYFGAGTEQVAEVVRKIWPAARVLRADRDVITNRNDYLSLYRNFFERKADILIGTQMIAKGMDFPGVTVVGVVAADTALHLPDFRSAERTFQLLVQASGRAGRGQEGGHVVIQTYNPDHYAIQRARFHDFNGFYDDEIVFRETLNYPPFDNLWLLEVALADAEQARQRAEGVTEVLRTLLKEAIILGPAPAAVAKLRDRYRFHTLVKHRDATVVREALKSLVSGETGLSITVDPYFML